jgi:hypothetical protein
MIKKNIIPVALLVTALLSGYFLFFPSKTSDHTVVNEQGGRNIYTNEEFDFSVTLPDEFSFYTTQRKESEEYVDIEFFMPSSDTAMYQQISGYAKPLVVRVVTNPKYAEVPGRQNFVELGRGGDKVYTMWLWKETPKDWVGKWNDDVRKKITDSFKIN